MDAKYSRWLSADPAVSDYIPMAPVSDEAKKHNEQLPGMGGIFNVVNFHLYHYAGNNPVKYTDPDGKFIGVIIGAAVGTVVSGGCEVFNQIVIQGKSLDNIDMRTVAIAAAGGAVSGAVAGTGIGLVGQIVINAGISTVQNVGNQALDISEGNQEKFDVASLVVDTAMGAVSGWAGGAGSGSNKVIDNAVKQLTNKVSKEIKHNGLSNIGKSLTSKTTTNAVKYFQKNTGKAIKGILNKVSDSAILTTAQNGLKKIAEDITNRD